MAATLPVQGPSRQRSAPSTEALPFTTVPSGLRSRLDMTCGTTLAVQRGAISPPNGGTLHPWQEAVEEQHEGDSDCVEVQYADVEPQEVGKGVVSPHCSPDMLSERTSVGHD